MTTSSQIEREIEATRDDIRRTMAALEGRLSGQALVARYLTPAKEGGAEFGRACAAAVRANPLALGVTAVGLGWLILGSPRQDGGRPRLAAGDPAPQRLDPSRSEFITDAAGTTYRHGLHDVPPSPPVSAPLKATIAEARQKAAATVDAVSQQVSALADEARERIADAGARTAAAAGETAATVRRRTTAAYHASRDTAGHLGHRLQSGARRAGGYARAHPLPVAAAILVGGAALALVLARRSPAGAGGEAAGGAAQAMPSASGAQHRNPPTPLSVEEEEPVFAHANTSAAAAGGAGRLDDIGAPVASSEAPASIAVGAVPGEGDAKPAETKTSPSSGNGPVHGGSRFGSTMDSNPDPIGRKA